MSSLQKLVDLRGRDAQVAAHKLADDTWKNRAYELAGIIRVLIQCLSSVRRADREGLIQEAEAAIRFSMATKADLGTSNAGGVQPVPAPNPGGDGRTA